MDYELRLHGGTAILGDRGEVLADVCISGGKIAAIIEPDAAASSREVLDVSGCVVMPGAIDAHVHLGQDITIPKTRADAEKETASALAGGVTSMLVYLMHPGLYEEAFHTAREVMEAHSKIDFGFHFCLVTPEQVTSIPMYMRELGVSSFKFFMNFRGDEGKYLNLPGNDDGFLFDLLETAALNGAMVDPHAENIELIWRLRKKITPGPNDGLLSWNQARPDYVEAEAEQRVSYLASVTGASLYSVHVTSRAALDVLVRQRSTYPNLFIETCPHYLTLDTENASSPRAKVNPPLRTAEDREHLWAAVADGRIDVVGSDHVPRHYAAKDKDIWSASAGFPGTGTLLPVLLSEGHVKRGIPLSRIAEVVSERPAKLFGLYPKKGVIAVGSDADLTVVDLHQKSVVQAADQHSGAEYSVWEGWRLSGQIKHVFLRGHVAVHDGVVLESHGTYLSRPISGAAALRSIET